MKNFFITMVLFLMNSTTVYLQEVAPKHQISINASKFIVLFNEQVSNLDLTYRYTLEDKNLNLRLATSIDLGTSETDISDYSVRIGADKLFKESDRWKFYVGMDANYSRTIAKSTGRLTNKTGLIPFIGILHHFGPHFSLSTEPSFAIFRNEIIDQDSFNPNASSIDYTFNFINLGQIKVGFHF